jgi:ATP-dependent RNA helicase RhlE
MSYSYRSRGRLTSPGRTSHKPPRHVRRKGVSNIDPMRFIRAASFAESEKYLAQHTFADFDVHPALHDNLAAKGYDAPSPIQDQTIPAALAGRDIIGIASTGTGKTAAFALPVLHRLMTDRNSAALIIAPTRELAQQIEDEFKLLARNSGLFGALLIGGTSMTKQLSDLKHRPRIVIGTPGRIIDHLTQKSLDLTGFNLVVLDEVDRMLDMGFVHDVTRILSRAAPKRQSFYFSATIDSRVHSLIDNFSADPVVVSIKASSASENVHQDIVRFTDKADKVSQLKEILKRGDVTKAIVFEQTKHSVERLGRDLIASGFSADSIHGGKTQGQRQRALNRFKKNEITVLVATNVAARGIDVSDISHVINFSAPEDYDDYIHRIGRAGRAGQVGYALTFVPHP